MNTQEIVLDISKEQIPAQIVRMGQGDSSGTTISATIYDHGTALDLTGFSAAFEMRLPDGTSYVRDTDCTVSGNVVTYVVDEEHCCAVAGYTDEAYFTFRINSAVLSTSRFRVKVEHAAHDGAVPAESWDTAVDDIIARGEAAIEEIEGSGITTASGTVDNSTGTPSVTVTLGQVTDSGRNIDFAFHNVKGAKGDKGDKGDTGPQGPTSYTLPTMDSTTKGGAKLGSGLTVSDDTLSLGEHKHSAGDITSGTLSVSRGGTGRTSNAINSVLTGNNTSAVMNVATANGALYATSINGAAQFGTLPVAQGGTGAVDAASARANLGAATSGTAAGTLYDAEQAIATNAGLIADLQSNAFLTPTQTLATGYDVNTIRTAGNYWVGNPTNGPSGITGYVRIINLVSNLQFAFTNSGYAYWRLYVNGEWNAWVQLS